MPQTEREHLTELDPDPMQLFAHRFVERVEQRTDQRRLDLMFSAFERVQDIVENVNRLRTAEQRLGVLLQAFAQHTPAAQQGAIYLSTSLDHLFAIGAALPCQPEIIGSEVDTRGSYIEAVAQVKSPVLLPDVQQEGFSGQPNQAVRQAPARSALVVPFIVGGKTVGVLSLENCERTGAFAQSDLDFAALLSTHTALAVDNARLAAGQPANGEWLSPELHTIQSLSQVMPFGVLIVTQDEYRVWGNPAFCRMTGFTQKELQNNLFRIHRSLAQGPGSAEDPADPQDLILTCQDRTLCPARVVLASFEKLGIRHAKGYVGIFEDMGEKNALERGLLHMQRLSCVSTLMSGAAHELNGPLTAVIGFAELLLSRQDVPPDFCQDLRTITQQAGRSIQVMRELLDYVQIEIKEPTEIDVNSIIRQLVRFRTYAQPTNGMEIRLDLCSPSLYVRGDAQQLQQVILNLINNAEQACSSANRPCKLHIRTKAVEDRVRISVRDNGPGIPTEIQARVFEPFFTTRPGANNTGLGLAVGKQIVRHHKGEIWFESEPDQGTTFFVDLPLRDPSGDEQTRNPPEPDPQNAKLAARILVVDDEKSISNLLSKVLTRTGHCVDVALDGREALRKLQENIYDVVFLDLKIPDVPGQAVYAWIKQNDARLVQRTVVLTGDTLNTDTITFLEQENIAHLLKPFQLVELRNVLHRVWPG